MTSYDAIKQLSLRMKDVGFRTKSTKRYVCGVRPYSNADWGQGFLVDGSYESSMFFEVTCGLACRRISERWAQAVKHAMGQMGDTGVPIQSERVLLGPRARLAVDEYIVERVLGEIARLESEMTRDFDPRSMSSIMDYVQRQFDWNPFWMSVYLIVYYALSGDMVRAKRNADRYFSHLDNGAFQIDPVTTARALGELGIPGYDPDTPLPPELRDHY